MTDDPFVEAIKLVAESSMASDRVLLELIQALINRVNEIEQEIKLLAELYLVKEK